MCIVLLTTAHPDYALIVIDNRDEFILRPTSRPHWWTPGKSSAVTPNGTLRGTPSSDTPSNGTPASGTPAPSASLAPPQPDPATTHKILSSRDLQRDEHGTWIGITTAGHFAVLTNFREDTPNDAAHPIHGQRSRGGMVTAWLTAGRDETTDEFVERMLSGPGVKGVGGFSLICGKLRKNLFDTAAAVDGERRGRATKGLAVVSNRADQVAQVPWIAGRRGEVYGLSNTSYDDPDVWPKVRDGKEALRQLAEDEARARAQAHIQADAERNAEAEQAVEELAGAGVRQPAALRDALFSILDRDTLPQRPDLSFEEQIALLKHSVFIPPIGDQAHRASMNKAVASGPRLCAASVDDEQGADSLAETPAAPLSAEASLASEERPDQQTLGFMTGMYGTQRQTVILVDWKGNVSYTERALWDANGNPIPRGEGDVHFDFQIEGWEE
ncbi:hypothetical protein HMPREF1624_06433 [Sporothrix schenckii ATCC 58251]|uniref:DUF833 domain-containing protein n=1 Tax=Sporothrix schenckii (strain ATCC 58251 / de Perez 2211183) TaxID=1391915 RepID=U7PQU0_SPOS1|nr:hypothetical protein HMPREF1624_06433 [Sporothrix schenckii ATCC 58251]